MPERTFPGRLAFWTLLLFLIAVVLALGVTLGSVPPSAQLVAGSVVMPVVAITLVLLVFEHRARPWAFLAASALGLLGVAIRLLVSTEPALEVGGGLPLAIEVAYVAHGLAVTGTSSWAYLSERAAARETSRAPDP